MSLQIKQNSSFIADSRWDWSIWLVGTAAELDQIDHVTYTLHPTFPNPVREIRTRKGGFRLKSSGWGEFTIYIDIARKDGEIIRLSHDLKLISESVEKTKTDATNIFTAAASHVATGELVSGGATISGSISQQAMPANKSIAKALYPISLEKAVDHHSRPAVFISGGLADAEAMHSLSKSLKKLDVRILSAEEMPSGVPFQVYIENMIDKASLMVFLVSGRPSMWMYQEIEIAKRRNKRIVPVLVGSESILPETLAEFRSLRIDNLENVADLAQDLLKL